MCYLRYKLDRCFVKSWQTSGDADDRPTEDVAFYYNRIAFQYLATKDGKNFTNGGEMKWDNVKGEQWDQSAGLM
jgi:type VI protein secretion system component Hcp